MKIEDKNNQILLIRFYLLVLERAKVFEELDEGLRIRVFVTMKELNILRDIPCP